MKRLATAFSLSAAVLLVGCGGVPRPAPIVSSPAPPTTTQSPVTPPTPSVAGGNWQFSAASTVPGKSPLTFSGSITFAYSLAQADYAVSGALHVDGSNCFNQLTTMGFAGTMTDGNTSLTAATLDGQTVTLTGNFANNAFAGTYSINGGCDAGDQGSVTGINIYIGDADSWDGTFTSSAQKTFNVSGDFAQSTSASPDGSFGITGTATFDTPCFSATALSPGSFPSGSFILGTLVSLQIKTDNGTVTFVGTLDPLSETMSGTYSVVGGTCDQTGTAVVALTGQWDY
jgi:hypothetical protein